MSDEHDGAEDPRFVAMYRGVVTRVDDPKGIGRVKVRVPGLLEPESAWALPMGVGNGPGRGVWFIPNVGSEVAVFLHQGDPDQPHYLAGNWTAPRGVPAVPSPVAGRSVQDKPKVRCIETDRWVIVLDDNATTATLALVDKTSGDAIEYNGLTRQLTIRATVGITIESVGAIDIRGLAVTIQGRPVATSSEPI